MKGTLMYKKLFGVLTAFALITVLFTACGIRDAATTSSGPTVHMGAASFLHEKVTVPTGPMITLIDDTTSPHIIVNGSWVNGVQKPATESGAPTVNVKFNGNDTASIGPFNTASSSGFHLYCTLHNGMNLVVIVQS